MLEEEYTKSVALSYRKELGQYFTPPIIATLMAKWVLHNNPEKILDPAFGLGVFLDSIQKLKNGQTIHFTAYEIDDKIINYRKFNKEKELSIINADYLYSSQNEYDAIICNPPYLRFQKFLQRHQILPQIEKNIGIKLVGYSNISSVFLLKSINELKRGGSLAYILPLEFFNTGYGKEIKKRLLENGLLKQIITFENEKEIFPSATTTVCILFCKKDYELNPVKITVIKSFLELQKIDNISNYFQIEINLSDLPANKKWLPIIKSYSDNIQIPKNFSTFSEYGNFTRGIATGANDFFALNKSKVIENKIDDSDIIPCITKSSQIRKSIFSNEDFDKLVQGDKYVYCLDVKNHNDLNVLNYLKIGIEKGYHNRFLTKTRKVWYKIETRTPAPLLVGVFNRGKIKIIRNYTNAINFTCYHSFYPNIFGLNYIDKLFLYLLSDTGQNIIKLNKRSYGNNLDKFEPNDLNNAYCPSIKQFEKLPSKGVAIVMSHLSENRPDSQKECNMLIREFIKNI
jgi:adenine-specific DNA-methyltransferase